MKTNLLITFIVTTILWTACQMTTPLRPLTTTTDAEFTLAPDQTAMMTNTELSIRLISVAGDERCPSEVECAASGPVSISLSVQQGSKNPTNINLQTFTDSNGRAPDRRFEGIEDRIVYEGYLIRMVGVLPYPVNLKETIKDSEYRVTFVVSKQ